MNGDDDAGNDRTPIMPPREFLADALRSLAGGLLGAVRVCEVAANVVAQGRGCDHELADLADQLSDLQQLAAGACRAVRRVREVEQRQPPEDP